MMGCVSEKVTRFLVAEEVLERMAEGRRSSQREGVGLERRVEVVEARELTGLRGEFVETVEDEARERRLWDVSSDWMRVAARV